MDKKNVMFPTGSGKTVCVQDGPVVMGILNVTQDSFFDGGKYNSELAIRKRIDQIADEGAKIIDVGACSTRPGAIQVSEDEEIVNLNFAMELIRRFHPELAVSIDTYRSAVVSEITNCFGPVCINDVSGGEMDANMFAVVAKTGLPYVLTHIQGTPENMQNEPVYEDVVSDVYKFFENKISQLKNLGFDNIVLDPGFGFGKTVDHNYQLMANLEKFNQLGFPVLVGISRKSMIYKFVGGSPQTSLDGTIALNAVSLMKGADIIRVHDVSEGVKTCAIIQKILQQTLQ